MRHISLQHAKATFSAIVDDAARGNPSIITRHGRPEAVVIGVAEWERLTSAPSFGRLLTSARIRPEDLPEREQSPLREADL